MGIVVTELPYLVGPEKVIEKIKDAVQSKRLQGISDVKDLTDRKHGLRLVIEVKNGFNPDAVLEQLYKLTPMEDSFSINNVALVDGQPKTLGLKDLLRVYVDFRTDVVRRRTEYRLTKYKDRLHLVEGLLIAIVDIDEVIQVIRTSDDAAAARIRLIDVFDLSEAQANYILELQLRRLTRFSRLELDKEKTELERLIEELEAILGDEKLLMKTVSTELADVAKAHGTPRRTVLLESAGVPATTTTPLEVADDPCWVLLSSTGLMARTGTADPLPLDEARSKHDALVGAVRTTARGEVGLVTSRGRLVRLSALELPTLPPTNGSPSLSGGAPLAAYVDLPTGEEPLTLVSVSPESAGIALGTAQGVVKRVTTDYPARPDFEIVSLKDGDEVVGAVELASGTEDLVFITSDAQLLRFGAAAVRPAGPGRRRDGRHQARLGPAGRVLRRGAPGRRRRGGHVLRLLRRAPRHRAGLAQGHPLLRVPGQGTRHRWGALPPLPQGRGHPGPGLGRRAAGAGRGRQRRGPRAPRGHRPPRRLGCANRDRHRPHRRATTLVTVPGPAPATHATPAPDACSVGFDRAGISAYGTAARATFFVALEQSGPWGRDAATESHLPAAVGRSLSQACTERGGRLSLIRRPGRHADDHHEVGHTAYLAWAGRGAMAPGAVRHRPGHAPRHRPRRARAR